MDRNIARWPKSFVEKPFVTLPGEDPFDQEDPETRAVIHHYLYLAEKVLSRYRSQDQAEVEDAA